MTARDYENRVQAYVNRLNQERRSVLRSIREVKFLDLMDTCAKSEDDVLDGYAGYGQRRRILEPTDTWEWFSCQDTWGGPDYHCMFAFEAEMTQEMEGRTIGFSLDTGATDIWNTDNPQIMVYVNGRMICAMDMNHHEVILSEAAVPGTRYDIRLYAYVNSAGKSNFLYLRLFAVEPEAEALYYDMKLPLETALLLRPEQDERRMLIQLLNCAGDVLDLRQKGSELYRASLKAARAYLQKELYEKDWQIDGPTVYALGHTHIDVAWKWPLRQTREKAVRSFSTVLYLMEQYPEYHFMSSQPQLYQYVKEEEPELYERIREKIKEGRWEAEGAMWLESDCNLTSGESLVRQILYGKAFFKEEFGVEKQDILWLPDAFGFLGALPQIMKRSGIRYFLTTKMGWNEADQQPDDIFSWEGIDGSRVTGLYITTKNYETYPEHFPKPVREVTYNGRQNANQIMGTWQNYRNKNINDVTLTVYGYGDGGGGPTQGMLEESKRLTQGVPVVPKVKMAGLKEYLDAVSASIEGKTLPVWYGDLYLEYHRGTFSSMAENKKANRMCEYRLQEAEWFSVLAWLCTGAVYPKETVDAAWKRLLLNQFHDILPGSAIGEVYEQSARDYRWIEAAAAAMIETAEERLLKKDDTALVVWNPLSMAGTYHFCLPNQKIYDTTKDANTKRQILSDGTCMYQMDLPAKGYRTLHKMEDKTEKEALGKGADGVEYADHSEKTADFFQTDKGILETPFYQFIWNDCGEIVSLYDKEANRFVLKENGIGNELRVYEDIPKDYDAWNIDAGYARKSWKLQVIQPFAVKEMGEICTVIAGTLGYQTSTIEQEIILYADSRRIDFKTRIDWREQQQLLKASFPLDIFTKKATCEIPFGVIERPTHRNTSWERARFEVCAHRFVDLSEPEYGAALLNDGRYGYSVCDSTVALTLLTSGIFPFADADKGLHEITYALLPHEGAYRNETVGKEAWSLNEKPIVAEGACGTLESWSMFHLSSDAVCAEAVKLSEDQTGIIVRIRECNGSRQRVTWSFDGIQVKQVWECNMMEEKEQLQCLAEHALTFTIKPFEVKTFCIIV